jgi:hypothetical protein
LGKTVGLMFGFIIKLSTCAARYQQYKSFNKYPLSLNAAGKRQSGRRHKHCDTLGKKVKVPTPY